MTLLTDSRTDRPRTIVRESRSKVGRQHVFVTEFLSGDVVMLVRDSRSLILEEIALKSYIDAYEILYDMDKGWVAGGEEIPYLESYCF